MTLLPDPAAVDAVAARLTDHAALTRHRADLLLRAAASTGWHGLAATAAASAARDTALALHAAADRLEHASRALHRHARQVEAVLHGLHALALRTGRVAEDVAGAMLHDAGSLVGLG